MHAPQEKVIKGKIKLAHIYGHRDIKMVLPPYALWDYTILFNGCLRIEVT